MDYVNFILLLLLVGGHTQLIVSLINRMYAIPVHDRILDRVRHVFDAWMLLFPLGVLWFLGLRGPRLLTGGEWSGVPLGWKFYLLICGFGAVGTLVAVVRWSMTRAPAVQLSNHSHFIDIEKRLGYRPVGDGRYRWLTSVPGNEAFRVQVSDKIAQPPRLPRELDELSILHLSDFHFYGAIDRPFFEEVCEIAADLRPDLIVFTGDLLDRLELTEWLPSTLGRLSAPLGRYFILGNHDWYLDADQIRAAMVNLGWTDVAGKSVTLKFRGCEFALGGTELPWMGRHPDWNHTSREQFKILLSHTPDQLPWARRQNVDLMLSGHNHGGQVVLPIIGPVFAPSRFGVRYAGGVYWQDPTLLYVSRGISGRHPLRWRCPPEVTKIILRAS